MSGLALSGRLTTRKVYLKPLWLWWVCVKTLPYVALLPSKTDYSSKRVTLTIITTTSGVWVRYSCPQTTSIRPLLDLNLRPYFEYSVEQYVSECRWHWTGVTTVPTFPTLSSANLSAAICYWCIRKPRPEHNFPGESEKTPVRESKVSAEEQQTWSLRFLHIYTRNYSTCSQSFPIR